jgi:hydrogenase maturation protein HypF
VENRRQIHITGIVQGVGFRPFIYNLATRFNLKGFCLNDSEGVTIDVVGDAVDRFIDEIKSSPPPLARIENLTAKSLPPVHYRNFVIRESVSSEGKSTFISPDASICGDCLNELLDPSDRRYLYPFINCTNCGPRYSIVRDIPYDRPKTTMAPFTMCTECAGEYHAPENRRFHAEPNGCEKCGPRVWLVEKDKRALSGVEINYSAIQSVRKLLKDGAIVAIKGLGGFHLACDATNAGAVKRLRDRKRKSNKPFAIMAPDVETVKGFCKVSGEEERLLNGRIRPIVILGKLNPNNIAYDVSPRNRNLGVMLPYTPLHYLLFTGPGKTFTALVMTSGNLSEEPIVISNEEAFERLGSIADYFLLHDRDIYMRVDDSIVKSPGKSKKPRVLRRARGFTPGVIDMMLEAATGGEEVLACGAELKNTLCLAKSTKAILSQHIGDMENIETVEFFKETLKNLKNTFRANPTVVAHDLHPDYLSTVFAKDYASKNGIPDERVLPVQHHHAHIVSVLAEHGLAGEVMGVAFDGTGYGTDGTVWGGEFMVARRDGFVRTARLDCIAMPGGDGAVREPWRMAASYLHRAYGERAFLECPFFFERIERDKLETVISMMEKGINAPLTSSAGRLFDAVSSILGIRDVITFEGEAAIELEMRAGGSSEGEGAPNSYPFTVVEGSPSLIDTRPLIKAVVEDVKNGTPTSIISLRFHQTVRDIILGVAKELRARTGIHRVVLSGGVFQNSLLLESTMDCLEREGFKAWTNERVPPNDGGISLGQAAVALEKLKKYRIADFK